MDTKDRDPRLVQFDDFSTTQVVAMRGQARADKDLLRLELLNAVLAERGYVD